MNLLVQRTSDDEETNPSIFHIVYQLPVVLFSLVIITVGAATRKSEVLQIFFGVLEQWAKSNGVSLKTSKESEGGRREMRSI